MVEVSTITTRKNGEKIQITVLLEDDLGNWLTTQPDSVIHDFVLFEYKNNSTNRAHDRRVQSLDSSFDGGHDFVDESADVLSILNRKAETEHLYIAIEKLEPQQRWIVREIYFNGRKQVEIAKELGIEKAAMESRLRKIHARLKKLLK